MQKHNIYNTLGINSLYLFWWFTAVSILVSPFSCGRNAAAPNFATAVMGCHPHNNVFQAETLVGISFQPPAGAGNSPSVSEGVAEGRGSNMSVKIPCAWLAARVNRLASLAGGVAPEEDSPNFCFLRAFGGISFSATKVQKFSITCLSNLYIVS